MKYQVEAIGQTYMATGLSTHGYERVRFWVGGDNPVVYDDYESAQAEAVRLNAESTYGLVFFAQPMGEAEPEPEEEEKTWKVRMQMTECYTVYVTAPDWEDAEDRAREVWGASEDVWTDFDGQTDGVQIIDCEEER